MTVSTHAHQDAAPDHSARNTSRAPDRFLSLWHRQIRPSEWINPRKRFDEAALQELAESIRENGLLEPIVVREIPDTHVAPGPGSPLATVPAYEILAGERRYRACILAGLEWIPAHVKEGIDDATAVRIALIENLQRQDLDPIEEAQGFEQLNRVAGMRQADIGAAVKRSQSAIANTMRLLELPEPVQAHISEGRLTKAHGIALCRYKDWPKVCAKVAELAIKGALTSKAIEAGFCEYGEGVPMRPLIEAKLLATISEYGWHEAVERAGVVVWKAGYTYVTPDLEGYKRERERLIAEQHAEQERAQEQLKQAKANQSAGDVASDGPLKLEAINYDLYRNIRHRSAPAGCTGDCPCRARAIDRSGEETEVCIDPKRFDALEKAAEKAERQAKKAEMERHLCRVEMAVGEVDVTDARAMAILAFYVLADLDQAQRGVALKRYTTLDAAAIKGLDFSSWRPSAKTLDVLTGARISPQGFIHVALYGAMRKELSDRYTGYHGAAPLTDWFLGDAPGASDKRNAETSTITPQMAEVMADIDGGRDAGNTFGDEDPRHLLRELLNDYELLSPDDWVADDSVLLEFAQDLLSDDPELGVDEEHREEARQAIAQIEAELATSAPAEAAS